MTARSFQMGSPRLPGASASAEPPWLEPAHSVSMALLLLQLALDFPSPASLLSRQQATGLRQEHPVAWVDHPGLPGVPPSEPLLRVACAHSRKIIFDSTRNSGSRFLGPKLTLSFFRYPEILFFCGIFCKICLDSFCRFMFCPDFLEFWNILGKK